MPLLGHPPDSLEWWSVHRMLARARRYSIRRQTNVIAVWWAAWSDPFRHRASAQEPEPVQEPVREQEPGAQEVSAQAASEPEARAASEPDARSAWSRATALAGRAWCQSKEDSSFSPSARGDG